VGGVFIFAFLAALNPTLLAATTVMLLLPHPERLLLGYLLGAALTSVTLGLVIVFTLQDSDLVGTTQNQLSPAADFALGGLALLVACVLGSGRDRRLAERRRARKAEKAKGPPRWQQFLGRGSARATFAVGVVLTLPGASYITGLNRIADQDLPAAATVAVVLAFNAIMLALLELPLLGYAIAPQWTPDAVSRFRAALGRRGRVWAVRGAAAVGVLLIARGILTVVL